MSDFVNRLISERKREITLTDDLIWQHVIKENPKRFLLKLPNELFLLFGISLALIALIWGFLGLDLNGATQQMQPSGENQLIEFDYAIIFEAFKLKIVFAFCASLLFIILAIIQRAFIEHYNTDIEKKYLELCSNIKPLPEQERSDEKPVIVDFSELTVHFGKLVSSIDQMNTKLDQMPDALSNRSSSDFQDALEEFSIRINPLPEQLAEVLKTREIESNEEKTLFRDAVSTFANWIPEFDEIKNSMVQVSSKISMTPNLMSESMDRNFEKWKTELDAINESMVDISDKIASFSNNIGDSINSLKLSLDANCESAKTVIEETKALTVGYRIEMSATNDQLKKATDEIAKVNENLLSLKPLTQSLTDLSASVSNHILTFNDFIKQVTQGFGETFSKSMGDSIHDFGDFVIRTFETKFSEEMACKFKIAIDNSSLSQSLTDLGKLLDQLNNHINIVSDNIQMLTVIPESLISMNSKLETIHSQIKIIDKGSGDKGKTGFFGGIFGGRG